MLLNNIWKTGIRNKFVFWGPTKDFVCVICYPEIPAYSGESAVAYIK